MLQETTMAHKPQDIAHEDRLLKPREAARELGVNIETVRRWMRNGAIPFVEVGPHKRKRLRESVVKGARVDRSGVPRATT